MVEGSKRDIITMAKKKRHLYLLEKLQRGKSLTPGEMKELQKLEGSVERAGVVNSQEDLARAFKVSVRTIQRWLKEGAPVTKDGFYDLLEIQAWHLTHNEQKKNKDSAINWDSKYRENKAKLSEIELKKKMGELISLEDVDKGRVERILVIKQALLGLPKAMAPVLAAMEDPRDIQEYLNGKIRDIIAQFSGQNIKKQKF